MISVAALWRHPIKGHGCEPLDQIVPSEGQCLPWDRRWAVAHSNAKADGSAWAAFDHQEFGIYAVVTQSGEAGLGNTAEVLS